MAKPARKPATPVVTDDRSDLFDEEFLKKLEYLHLISRKTFQGALRAERRTKKVGGGIEFADHRKYSLGDDFRYIDWNVYGRVDKLLLRLFEEEEDLHIYILLDCSRSMLLGEPLKLHYAMRVAAALTYIGLANLDRVGIIPFADKLRGRLPMARGKRRIFKVFQFLQALEAGGVTQLGKCMDTFVHQNKRRGLAVLISDFYDPAGFEEGINELRYNKFEPFVLHVVDPADSNPALQGDLVLYDCETGEEREVTITKRVLERYTQAYSEYLQRVQRFCVSRQVTFFSADVNVPFDELILRVFRRGGFLR